MNRARDFAERRADDAADNRPPAVRGTPRLIRLPEVLRLVPLKRSTIYSRVAKGIFPKPIPLGSPHAVAWLAAEIHQWVDEQIRAARSDGLND